MNAIALDSRASILIIESDQLLAENISNDLHESGYFPVVAHNTAMGLHQVTELQPALIVIELMLGGGVGIVSVSPSPGNGLHCAYINLYGS
ncbi:two component transcriptional regulator [Arthrospira platensis C1]|nr:two component transcriptional regulator [Arthrospira platensis C1]